MIKTDRLILRRITKEDVADIHVMNSFSEVERYNTIGIPKTIEDTAAILAKEISAGDETYNNFFSWVISLANDNSFLGKVPKNINLSQDVSVLPVTAQSLSA